MSKSTFIAHKMSKIDIKNKHKTKNLKSKATYHDT